MEPTDVAKALILGKFAKELAEELYSGKSLDEIEDYLARDLRIVNREAQQRFVAIIGPGLGIDATSTNVFGTLTPTIDDVLGYTLKAGFALQVGFNYGLVNGDWRKAKVYSSELYALEKVVIEVEGKDASALDEVRRAARQITNHLLSYVKDVYLEYSGNRSIYIALWLPNPVVEVRAGGHVVPLHDFYRTLGVSLIGGVARRVRGLVDMQFINAVKLLRVPGYPHEATGKPAQYLDTDLKPAEFDPGVMDRAIVSPRFLSSIVNRIILNWVDRQPRRRPRKRVKLGKVEEWNIVVKYMLDEGVRVNDGRIRFSYVLGNWCAARRMSLDKCRELHSRLVEGANAREYQRYLEYGYQHPEYLPWPYTFFRGSEWYSVPDVEVFQDVYEALRGRVTKHVEVKHATPKPEVEVKTGADESQKPEPKVDTEVETEASPEVEVKPSEAVVGAEVGVEANAQPGQKPEPQASEAKVIEAEPNAQSSGTTQKPVVDVRGVVDRVKSWLIILFKYNSEVVNKLEPIIEQMVSFIVERGVVGKWELWDRFYNEVKKLNTDDAGSLFSNTLDIIIMAMEGMGLLKVNKNILTVVGKTSEAKPSEANAAKTEGKSSRVNETKPEAKVEVKTQPEQELEPPVGSEVKVEGNVSEAKAGEALVVEIEANAPKTEVEGSSSGVNQSGQAGTPVPEPNQELHGANHDSPTQPESKANINIGDFINYSEAPVEAIVIRQSIIHSETVEAPVNIATVDRIARRLCNSEDCIVSARLAITFIIGAVGKGPVRVGWLEKELKSRHPLHYEVLRGEGINMWVILTQLRGLGIVVVSDIVTPGGWHSKWVTGLVTRLLEARGRVSLSELVKMVRESEPDLPNAFEGGLTLGDHVALAVKYLEWRGAVKVEGEAVTLV
ncbi:MAG: hypothetical protein RXQ94_05185 [Caldivirga sp.]